MFSCFQFVPFFFCGKLTLKHLAPSDVGARRGDTERLFFYFWTMSRKRIVVYGLGFCRIYVLYFIGGGVPRKSATDRLGGSPC
jgi:hypothetical protein